MFNSFGYQRGEVSGKICNVINMSLLWSEASSRENGGYKHLAPPEQSWVSKVRDYLI